MFTSIRKYLVRRGSAGEFARRVQDDFVPLLRQMRGFRGYYLLDGGLDVLITISMFDSAYEALASNVTAADWVRNNVLDFTRGLPEVMVGNVLIAEVASQKPPALADGIHDPDADPASPIAEVASQRPPALADGSAPGDRQGAGGASPLR